MEGKESIEKKYCDNSPVETLVVPELQDKVNRLKKLLNNSIGNCHLLENGGVEFIGSFSEGWDEAMKKILKYLEA